MITKIKSLKELPYTDYEGYVLKTEQDTDFVGERIAYLFISESPVCIFLFIKASIVNNNG